MQPRKSAITFIEQLLHKQRIVITIIMVYPVGQFYPTIIIMYSELCWNICSLKQKGNTLITFYTIHIVCIQCIDWSLFHMYYIICSASELNG